MAALFSDENVDLRLVLELRRLGHDVVRAIEIGRANLGIPDPEQLRFATSVGRAVLTFDGWDFIRLHRHDANHAGIVACTKSFLDGF